MKALKFILSPLLLLAIIFASLYYGIARPGAVSSATSRFMSEEAVQKQLATKLVDQLVESDNILVKALLTADRPKAEAAITRSLSNADEQRDIAKAAEAVSAAMFAGKPSIELDAKPIYRPIYRGIDAVFPALKLEQTQLQNLEPIKIGTEQPLPDLGPIRTGLTFLLFLWPLWIGLAIYFGRRKPRTLAIQTLVVSALSLVIVLIVPAAISAIVADPLQHALVYVVLSNLVTAALWISLLLVIISTAALLLIRKRVMAGQGAAQSE